MIFATTQKPEKYDVVVNGRQRGLYTSYFYDPLVFNLMTRVTMTPFQYEPDSIVEDRKKHIRAAGDDVLEPTLRYRVGGREVRELLRMQTPVEMVETFLQNLDDVAKLPITMTFCEIGGIDPDPEMITDIMLARSLQWKRYWRGKISETDRTVQISFGTNLTPEEHQYLMRLNIFHINHERLAT